MIYTVDDGTDAVDVVFNHEKPIAGKHCWRTATAERHSCDFCFLAALAKTLSHLKEQFNVLKSEIMRMPKETTIKPMLSSLSNIINRIERNVKVRREKFPSMCKVFVVGTPYRKPFSTKLTIYAFHMQIGGGANCDMEIDFKIHLSDLYQNVYLN